MTVSHFKKRVPLVFFMFMLFTSLSFAYEPDKSTHNVQKKAVIITHDAKLLKQSTGTVGGDAAFMNIYFIMKPSTKNRTPVSITANKSGDPDGWLENNSFHEWNTIQMIKLEPQTGRSPAKIFSNVECTDLFAKDGKVPAGCEVIGSEPNRAVEKKDLQLLIPVFQKIKNNYQAGFIRVFESGDRSKSVQKTGTPLDTNDSATQTMGYDVVFAIDRTGSMQEYYLPTIEVIQTFIRTIESDTTNPEMKTSLLKVGLLFYQDRLIEKNKCMDNYPVTEWGQELTSDINAVINVLKNSKSATCSSEEPDEAVFDGLNRILIDTKWRDNAFKTIILIGDASPHKANHPKNPFHLSTTNITKEAEEKGVRFMSLKLGKGDESFKYFAVQREINNKGRYKEIPIQDDKELFKSNLLETMKKEWVLLTAAVKMTADKVTSTTISTPQVQSKYNLTRYQALIIQSRLPSSYSANTDPIPEFVNGWIPERINNQLAVSEFLFMGKSRLLILINILEGLSAAADIGITDGPTAFITTVRTTISSQLGIPPSQVFSSGETLSSMLEKAEILPFKTNILNFTGQEVGTWKPADFKRINTILQEKAKLMREHCSNPSNFRYFGDKPHFYVPRQLFP